MNATTGGGAPAQVHRLEMAGVTENLAMARDTATTALRGRRAGDDVIPIVQLVISELVTNAIEAAPGDPLTLTVDLRDGEVDVSVRSRGSLADVEAGRTAPERRDDGSSPGETRGALVMRGRGLDIVRSVSRDLRMRSTSDDHGYECVEVTAVLSDRSRLPHDR